VTARHVAAAVVAGACLVAFAACGNRDDTGSVGSGGSVGATTTSVIGGGAQDVALAVQVSGGAAGARTATLSCGGSGPAGTGFLAGADAADAACRLVTTDGAAEQRLVEGPTKGVMCTDIYGGPEVAVVTGTISGLTVDAHVDRVDGCGVADWTLLQPLLGPPE
jgi:hypothetical protein